MKLDKSYKVHVTPEQSREIHSLILLNGGEVSYGLKPQLQDEFLVIENEYGYCVIYYTDQDIYPTIKEQEIQADDLIAMLTDMSKSEPEIDTTQNSVDAINATDILDNQPMGTRTVSEPQFKGGDKVYAPSVGTKIYTLKDAGYGWCYPIRIDCDYDEDHEFTKEGLITAEGLPILFLATELNHALLSQLYPNTVFEAPPTELKGSDLCRAMLEKGWKYVPCYISDSDDEHALYRKPRNAVVINGVDVDHPSFFVYGGGKSFIHFAVPFNPKTGDILTAADVGL